MITVLLNYINYNFKVLLRILYLSFIRTLILGILLLYDTLKIVAKMTEICR